MTTRRHVVCLLGFVLLSMLVAPTAVHGQTDTGPWMQTQELFVDSLDQPWAPISAVAVDGDRLAVGLPLFDHSDNVDNGMVFVFGYDGTRWSLSQRLTAFDHGSLDEFGRAVALEGRRLVVGAPRQSEGHFTHNGAVYVFEHDGARWVRTQKLLADDTQIDGNFGRTVALRGQQLAIASGQRTTPDGGNGATVFMFEHDGVSWTQTDEVSASDGVPGDRFGDALSLRNTSLVVGAPGVDDGDLLDTGAVYVFERDGDRWQQRQKLVADDRAEDDGFGYAVAHHGIWLAVGALRFGAEWLGEYTQGSVYLFGDDGTSWRQVQKLLAHDLYEWDYEWMSLALEGDRLAIGTTGGYDGTTFYTGAVYIFERGRGCWGQAAKLLADEPVHDGGLGHRIALDGGRLVAATYHSNGAPEGSGSVFVFDNPSGGFVEGDVCGGDDADVDTDADADASLDGDALTSRDTTPDVDAGPTPTSEVTGTAGDAAEACCTTVRAVRGAQRPRGLGLGLALSLLVWRRRRRRR